MYRLLLCALFVGFATATYYETCDSPSGKVTSVTVTNCNSNPCILKHGTKPQIEIDFESLVETKTVTVNIMGIIGGIPLPFPAPHPNGCENSGLTCPLQNGKSYKYSSSINVINSYPQVAVTVQYKLIDENGKDIVCVKIPSKIEA